LDLPAATGFSYPKTERVATSYSASDKFYIDLRKLLPLARFLPQPKYDLFASLCQKINLHKYHTISFPIDVLYMEMNKGEAEPNYFCSFLFEVNLNFFGLWLHVFLLSMPHHCFK